MESNLTNLKEGLIDSSVIDIAVNLHAILEVISNNFSKEAVIDVIPAITSLLNKYDAAIKVNEDLKENLACMAAENISLEKSLLQERKNRKYELDDSICNEERADAEIGALKSKLISVQATVDELKMEISSKDAIINLLESDAKHAANQIETLEYEVSLLKKKVPFSSAHFTTPKKTVKLNKTSEYCGVEVSNRFSSLDDDNDSELQQPVEGHTRTFRVKAHVHRRASELSQCGANSLSTQSVKNRIVILADSQGRDMYNFLSGLYNDYDIFVYALPGAKMKQVVKNGLQFVKHLTKSDYVFVMAGSNDFGGYEPGHLTVQQGLDVILGARLNANIIISSIPIRYDVPHLNEDILFANAAISNRISLCRSMSTITYIDFNGRMQRYHFSKGGLHYGKKGKRLLGKTFCEMVIGKNQSKRQVREEQMTTCNSEVPSMPMETCDDGNAIIRDPDYQYSITPASTPLAEEPPIIYGETTSSVFCHGEEILHRLNDGDHISTSFDDGQFPASASNNSLIHSSTSFLLLNQSHQSVG
ncbi:hypothetical protein LSTR_LSTR015677 [Laodelphax striatellus]|uniref:Uncharacterized protein n=1 Tax=Laodelphax striatellus TaxID=195883 RepID=A0A482WMS0_LAOST|nr:hypothetical protein LSTR_LSTR015677 [Laodelphax striatellus]